MGVGFRMAMRVVALTDSTLTPEFTMDGTAFILLGIGLMLGSVAGAYLGGLRYLLVLRTITVAFIATAAIIPLLFGGSEIRSELFELGLGGWVNIPMFTSIVFAYGWAQDVCARRLDRRAGRKRAVAGVAEPAPVP
jgi:hypothetical protein